MRVLQLADRRSRRARFASCFRGLTRYEGTATLALVVPR